MSDNKPEPVVTQEDQDAATAYRVARYRAALNNCELGAVDLDIAFAAHRTAAVARREAEIVGMLKQLSNMHQETALRAKKNEHWSTEDREWFAGQVLESIVAKIQNGGGA